MANAKVQQIKKQVEFYFSDSNFPKDKFLRAQAALNEEGYVSVNTIAAFNRMKQITTDVKEIIAAIASSDVVAANPEGTMLKRKNPLPENDDSLQRTIYAKGFPTEGISIEDVIEAFKGVGTALCVRIRKDKEKKQKESCFVEFSTIDEATKAVKNPPKYKDTQLVILSKNDYVQKKKDERKEKKEKKAKDGKSEENANGDEEPPKKKQKTENENANTKDMEFPKGVVISFKGIGGGVTREILKEEFGKFGPVAFVDFQQNESDGFVRMSNAEDAKKSIDEITSKGIQFGGQVPSSIVVLQGEEETAYWLKIKKSKSNKKKKGGGKKRKRF